MAHPSIIFFNWYLSTVSVFGMGVRNSSDDGVKSRKFEFLRRNIKGGHSRLLGSERRLSLIHPRQDKREERESGEKFQGNLLLRESEIYAPPLVLLIPPSCFIYFNEALLKNPNNSKRRKKGRGCPTQMAHLHFPTESRKRK